MPETDVERKAVREQLDRVLASPLFKNSKRYPSLLRYVVERSLDGHTGHLKERTLGIEVFGREPDYDTNLDPVVRTSAVEIRKRIAQYYHEPGHETEIRIDFPPGTYLPEFRQPQKPVVEPPPPPRKRTYLAGAIGAAVLVLFSLLLVRRACGLRGRHGAGPHRFGAEHAPQIVPDPLANFGQNRRPQGRPRRPDRRIQQ